jgi:hypothetical protein
MNRLRSFTPASDPALTANREAELETLLRAGNYTVPPDTNRPVPAARVER